MNGINEGIKQGDGSRDPKVQFDQVRAHGYGENSAQRTFRDYLLILRERMWLVIAVFLTVFLASLIYALTATKQYTSQASIEILARDPVVMKVQEVRATDLRGPEDLNTEVKILESSALIQKVVERLTTEESKRLLAPYEKDGSSDPVLPDAGRHDPPASGWVSARGSAQARRPGLTPVRRAAPWPGAGGFPGPGAPRPRPPAG